ncbi:MAG: carboxypeptidase regulatory-like domain-containing protein [Myxococcaceae bacterium]
MLNTWKWATVVSITMALAMFSGCQGPQGDRGPAGPDGVNGQDGTAGTSGQDGTTGPTGVTGSTGTAAPTTGTLSGTVTDGVKLDVLAGVTVTAKDSGGTTVETVTTGANGAFSMTVPFGTLSLSFAKANYTSPAAMPVGALAGQAVTINVTMNEATSGKPSVTVSAASNNVGYGATVTLTATATDPNGDTLTYAWTDGTALPFTGVTVVAGTPPTSAVLTMPTIAAAFAKRFAAADPSGFTSGYTIEDRFGILPISADTRAGVAGKVTVSDGRGQSTAVSVTVNAAPVLTGAESVAIKTRVYLNSGHTGTNAWVLTTRPTGSTAALDDATSRHPSFIPDLKGKYTLTEGTNTLDIFAGDWKGVITGVGTTGPNSVAVDSACTGCHNGTTAPDNFTPWKATGHATMFSTGVNGAGSASYGARCLTCHTVGNDPAIANGGFDDVAATNTWTFPTPLTSANWTNMVTAKPAVARLANIQCESCHGPQTGATGEDAHMMANSPTAASMPGVGPYKSPRINYSSEVCATCHAAGSGHHLYSEWNTVHPVTGSGHSRRGTATTIGVRGGVFNGHCGRCHTAQGFILYVDQLKAGITGNIAAGSLVLTDVTAANAEPVTCTACHDSHDSTNPNQLRVYGNTPALTGGFTGYGLGKGALCATCHNSRNGAHAGTTGPTSYSAPHQACQTDVFTGNNAYFMGSSLPMTSRHSAIEDTCVGCHMALNPKTHLSHGTAAHNGHEFRILRADLGKLCSNCHGGLVNGEGIQASIEASLHALETKMGNAAKAKINAVAGGTIRVRAFDAAADQYSSSASSNSNISIDVVANPVIHVGIVEGHGQVEFHLEFATPISIQFLDSAGNPAGAPRSVTEFGVQMGSLKDNAATPAALYAASSNMTRAGWNYFLIEGDHSLGLHNPTFAQQVLTNTMAQDLSL